MLYIDKKQERRNIMSYMITYMTKEGIVIASDSYSCYGDRTLKDSNYKKIHQIGDVVIASTGLNGFIDEKTGKVIDINDTYESFFKNFDSIEEQINQYIAYIKRFCDRYVQDIRLIIVYKDTLYVIDIIHSKTTAITVKRKGDVDIFCSGDELIAVNGLMQFRNTEINVSLKEAQKRCIESVKYAIMTENALHIEGQRTIGGKVQYLVIPFD